MNPQEGPIRKQEMSPAEIELMQQLEKKLSATLDSPKLRMLFDTSNHILQEWVQDRSKYSSEFAELVSRVNKSFVESFAVREALENKIHGRT